MEFPSLAWTAALVCIASHLAKVCSAFAPPPHYSASPMVAAQHRCSRTSPSLEMISSGFSFSDGAQVLVSLQKPMGIVLEQDEEGPITVAEVSPGGAADGAGVEVGDILLAVQNASVEEAGLEEVLAFIGKAPRVVNLRFLRKE